MKYDALNEISVSMLMPVTRAWMVVDPCVVDLLPSISKDWSARSIMLIGSYYFDHESYS